MTFKPSMFSSIPGRGRADEVAVEDNEIGAETFALALYVPGLAGTDVGSAVDTRARLHGFAGDTRAGGFGETLELVQVLALSHYGTRRQADTD